MEKQELIKQLESLAESAELSEDRQCIAAAGVIYSLMGSLHEESAFEMLESITGFSMSRLLNLKSKNN